MKSVVSLVLVIMLLGCCQKDNLTEKEILLTSHGWSVTTKRLNGIEIIIWEPWQLDDCIFYYPDGTYLYSYGTIRAPGQEQDMKGTWELIEDETKLYKTYGSTPSLHPPPSIDITENAMILTFIGEAGISEVLYGPC